MSRFCQFHKKILYIKSEIKLLLRGLQKTPSSALSLDDVVERIKSQKIKRIVVLTGAGLSTASGVPDFRTPGSGLYDNLASYNVPYPEAIFEITYFLQNPRPFYSVAKQLCSMGQYEPNYAHYFIFLLHKKEILLCLYTQNIDGLERSSGIPESKLIEAHGSFNTATCTSCKHHYNKEDVQEAIKLSEPFCKQPKCKGIIKPDVVFFGENLPLKFYKYVDDLKICDLLLVMGTSLEVYPFAAIVEETNPKCPRILFNRDAVGPFVKNLPNDIVVKGDLIESLAMFARKIGWQDDMNRILKIKS